MLEILTYEFPDVSEYYTQNWNDHITIYGFLTSDRCEASRRQSNQKYSEKSDWDNYNCESIEWDGEIYPFEYFDNDFHIGTVNSSINTKVFNVGKIQENIEYLYDLICN